MESSANKKRAPRCVLYSHDTMGFGHIRRNILLSQAVLDALPNAEVLMISGVREAGSFTLRKGVDSVILPSYIKTPEGKYLPRSIGEKINPLVKLREQIIYAALNAFSPDMMIVDNVPRGAMRELDLSLPLLARKGTHMLLGLRDIIDEPHAVKKQWEKQENSQAIRDFYSTIWVYGDKRLYDLRQECHFDVQTNKKITFTGYLDSTCRLQSDDNDDMSRVTGHSPYVLCVVGGGQDGFRLAETFVRARLPAGFRGVLVTGSMMPEAQRLRLQQLIAGYAEKSITGFVAEPLKLLRNAHTVVAMGGYNTVMEILTFHKTALIVPRVSPRQEQWIRAERLSRMGLLDCVHPDNLTVDLLSDWLASPHHFANPRQKLDFSGLNFIAESVRGMIKDDRMTVSERVL